MIKIIDPAKRFWYNGTMKASSQETRPVLNHRPYFFDNGIRFGCRRCGQCCVGDPGTIYIAGDEIQELAAHFKMPVERFIKNYPYPFKDSCSIREHSTIETAN